MHACVPLCVCVCVCVRERERPLCGVFVCREVVLVLIPIYRAVSLTLVRE